MNLTHYTDKLQISLKGLAIVYVLLAVGASVQAVLLGENYLLSPGDFYTHYNNYVIFKQSFFHLLEGKDLYILFPADHHDLYKYSPTFALLFAPMAILPDWLGLSIWNLLNALTVVWGVSRLSLLNDSAKKAVLIFVAIELLTSLQNAQSSGLMAGLVVWAFACLERKQYAWAMLLIVITGYIKIFWVLAFAVCIFYPEKWRMVAYAVAWTLLLLILPLLAVSPAQLVFLYKSWWTLLLADHDTSYGLSVMGWLQSWFQVNPSKNVVTLTGLALLLLPLLKWRLYPEALFRVAFMASLLLWLVIFNPKAESPAFIIAMLGVGLWYFTLPGKSKRATALVVLAFVLTSLSPTDIFPATLRQQVVVPFVLKVVPCIMLWGYINYRMWRMQTA
jgi:hypothetical protein